MKRLNFFYCAVFALLCAILPGCSNSGNTADLIDLLPVQTEEDGKWSFVDRDGKIKYEDEFKEAPSCVVNGVFSVSEKDGYTLYKAESKPTPIKNCEGLKAAGYLSDGLIPIVRDKSRITLIDDSGQDKFTLQPVKGKEIVSCAGGYSDGMLKFEIEGGEIGFVNTTGEPVVKPIYEAASDFSDGRAVVKKDDTFSIIDKKGNTVLKLKKDWTPRSLFAHGVIAVEDANDHILFVDEKGETEKCPAKVKEISDFNEKYYIFSDGDSYGVMSRKDNEVIIRAKYNKIIFGKNDTFICTDDKDSYILNSKGDVNKTLDEFEDLYALGNFGILAKDKKTWLMLDNEGVARKGCEFYNIHPLLFLGYSIESDYFNLEGMANTVVEKLNSKGYGDIKLGASPQSILSDPSNYNYTSNANIESLNGEGYKFSYTVSADFSGTISSYNYDYYYYGGNSYNWNNVNLNSIDITINAQTSLGSDAVKAVVSALEKKGFKLYASNYKGGGIAALTSSESMVLILSSKNSNSLAISLLTLPNSDQLKQIKEAINKFEEGDDTDSIALDDSMVDISADTVAVEEVEVVTDTAYAW